MIRSIESCLWQLYKHFPGPVIDALELDQLTSFVMENIKGCDTDLTSVKQHVTNIVKYRKQLHYLRSQPQVKQRSQEWYDMRKERLTASSVAQAIGKGKFGTRNDLISSKAFPESVKQMDSMKVAPLRHGIILEDMTARCYSQRNGDMKIHAFGMIPHPSMQCFGASPDGINELGIMVEIKTPYRRQVDGNIPEEYILQMQGQMAVCGLDECDFVDCDIQMIYKKDDYISNVQTNQTKDHGVILEKIDNGEHHFEYSPENLTPEECLRWASDMYQVQAYNNMLMWKLRKIVVQRVNFDKELWKSLAPQIESFWNDVIEHRKTKQPPQQTQNTETVGKRTYNFVSDSDSDEAI